MSARVRPALQLVPRTSKVDPIFGARPRGELEFLPAALEIVETPPPPLSRVTGLALVALLVSAIAWACLGQIDVVSTAQGRLVPAGGGKVVQPLEAGTVAAIRVRDGQVVKKGEVLVELEPTETLADRDRLRGELAAARLEVARLLAVALGRPFTPPTGADPAAATIAAREANAEIAQNAAKLAALDRQVEQHRAEFASAASDADRLRTLLPLAEQRSEVYQSLQRRGYGSRLQLIEAEEKRQDTLRSLDAQQHKAPELEASIAATARERARAEAEAAKTTLAALTEAQVKAASLEDELQKAQGRLVNKTLVAPVDGTVQELAIHTVGGVVQPGQTLMRVAPVAASVEVEANLENRDIGFVRADMPAEIKVETFPFTRYGLIPAKVLTVSSDAVVEDHPEQAPADRRPDAPEDRHYSVKLGLQRDTIEVDGRRVRLAPGMTVTAEIKTGRRRVISYILSPLSKATEEAGHER